MLTTLLPLIALASEVLPPQAHRAISYADRDPAKNLLDLYVPAHAPNDDLEREIMNTLRRRLSPLAMPQEIAFVPSLPKTRSGKIMRRVLRAQEWGEPVGDLSTMMEE